MLRIPPSAVPVLLAALVPLAPGCSLLDSMRGKPQLPEKIQGQWEVFQVETKGEVLDAQRVVKLQNPHCIWGRMTWTFDEGHVTAGYDVLCPAETGEYYGCEVSARLPAAWDEQKGVWHLDSPIRARSRTVTRAATDGEPTATTNCQVTLQEGDYVVAKARGHEWRWEMLSPDETSVYRLQRPSSERPDFVAAIHAQQGEVQ
ncbi:MAG: hypothetical protein R3F59_08975 [Myxococcota bacterium]